MEEEKVTEGESSDSNSGGGASQVSKKQNVSGRDSTGLDPADGEPAQDQNPPQAHKGRGRPKGSKKPTRNGDDVPIKRGRPKKIPLAAELPNGGPSPAKRELPSGSAEDSSATPRQRGRPKKKPRLESTVSVGGSGLQEHPQKRRSGRPRKAELQKRTLNDVTKRRGRPRKNPQESGNLAVLTGAPPTKKRGRGRPKGSLNEKAPSSVGSKKLGRPRTVPVLGRKRGRPRQQPVKRGRPRKHPRPPHGQLNKPRVWKPLGRPRKHPRVDAPAAPRRAPGRPRKSEFKRGAHLRKSIPTDPPAPHAPSEGTPRKRGRPPNAVKGKEDTPRKRGRPRSLCSVNNPPSHQAANDSSTAEREAVPADSCERRDL